MTSIPGYWMNETSGVLAPVVEKYLNAGELDIDELALMRAYLEQWTHGFVGSDVAALRARLPLIHSTADLGRWLADAIDAGIDPLWKAALIVEIDDTWLAQRVRESWEDYTPEEQAAMSPFDPRGYFLERLGEIAEDELRIALFQWPIQTTVEVLE